MSETYLAKRLFSREALLGRPLTATERAELLRTDVNALLGCLYVPAEDGLEPDWPKLAELGIAREAINWGDLEASDVEFVDGRMVVVVEEASPAAWGLRTYLRGWLHAWGWTDVDVQTEW